MMESGSGNPFFDLLASLSALPYGQALLILAATLLFAFVAIPVLTSVVRRLTSKTQTDVDDQLIETLRGPLFNSIVLAGVLVALPTVSLPSMFVSILTLLIQTLLVFIWIRALVRVAAILIGGAIKADRLTLVNEQTKPLFNNLSLILVWAAGLYALFLIWGVDVTAWLASAGVVGIAVGFAAKDTLANIISGVFIIADEPYKVGDYITLESGEQGTVANVGLRSTRIQTFDNAYMIIPNSVIANATVTNITAGPPNARMNTTVGVAYGTDIDEVEQLLLDIAKNHESVIEYPAPSVRFINFGDSSLDFKLNFWVKDAFDGFAAKHEINGAIYKRFAEAGIEIPFPQRDVNLKK